MHLGEAAQVSVNRGFQIATGLAALTTHDLPEHAVIRMAAGIIAQRRAHSIRRLGKAHQHIINLHGGKGRIFARNIVECGDSGGMVPAMVQFHGHGINRSLIGVGRIGQRRKCKGASWCLRKDGATRRGKNAGSCKPSRQKATAREMNGHDISPQGCAMCLSLSARRRLTPEDAGLSKKIPASAKSDYGLGAASAQNEMRRAFPAQPGTRNG